MKRRLIAFLLAALSLAAPASRALAAGCVLEKVADLPVTMSGMRPLVSAKINGCSSTRARSGAC
jgi:hypothetical protein